MKNILVLSKIYPADDLKYGDTKVVHYFAKEWQNLGYNVKVIHNLVLFPKIILAFAYKFQKILASKFGAVVPFFFDKKVRNYLVDGVDVCRIPIMKFIPHGMFSKRRTRKQFETILQELEKDGFIPDIVVGHWWSPQLELLSMLKKKYSCKTCMVVHNIDSRKKSKPYLQYFKDIDIWGMRSKTIQKEFIKIFGSDYKTFLCFSGVPVQYVCGNTHTNFNRKPLAITFVGNLIERKHPLEILKAVATLPEPTVSSITFIGDGAERKRLHDFAVENNLLEKTHFLGRISRDNVSEELKKADVFVMISEEEAFGLVYLEAMGAGCLTIASKNEGMDGIIIHNENGFLSKAGDSKDLAKILCEIYEMSCEEKKRISDNAVKSALDNTDFLAAQRYINQVES
ncbi:MULTISPECIES: glycosyltransferase [unclassified Fibrobacter]|uniref:glycosyltransferase n=1 Tax=unclassified Fibrobacter TaxID=2634177 RepID=UPI000D6CBADB|nr:MULTISPECIES: glycosyltransferase [unclassified Fibrobacter]PWJ55904.1 glycosyltransferase involved in cell wall biosynthesis [Fibrobacter sp. UWR4]PZW61975.1 glycosyltransferase involved in cell wall biosynthesis [Fibrobacter sp. UWR1]